METFHKTRLTLWRDRLLALALLLIGLRLVSAAFQAHGHEIVCLILQISASAVLLAAGGLSIFMLSEPTLNVDKIGISESGFLFKSFNWSMTWNDIAYAQLTGELRSRVVLVGLFSDQPEHVLSGYERFDAILEQIGEGLKRYGRKVVQESPAPKASQS
ncbi:MAG TPA: hypothetical protein VI703_03570 [Anaerolineales bacterium]|nr:hypothetical protein [Anaerolineales bacterium]